jgi:hypothetical protein
MPPLPALLALHGLWLLLIVPLALLAIRRCSPQRLRLLGTVLTVMGLIGLGILAGQEAVKWLPSVPEDDRPYLFHRVLFVLFAERTDVPLLSATLAGAVCWFVGRRRALAFPVTGERPRPTTSERSESTPVREADFNPP